jgi:hypothetical protein
MAFQYTRCTIFQGADCDTEHYLMVAKFMETLTVNKQAAQNLDMERFNLRKLRELEVRNQCQIEISSYISRLSHPLDLITQVIFGEEYKSVSSSLSSCRHSAVILFLLAPNIILSSLVSKTPSLRFSLNVSDTFSHPYTTTTITKTTGNLIVFIPEFFMFLGSKLPRNTCTLISA